MGGFSNHWKMARRFFQSLEKPALALLLAAGPARAADLPPTLGTNTAAHLRTALAYLNMTEADLAFQKNVGQPLLVLRGMTNRLQRPLELPALADQVRAAAAAPAAAPLWDLAAAALEVDAPAPPAPDESDITAVEQFLRAARPAAAALARAFEKITPAERRAAAVAYLAGLMNAEDYDWARAALRRDGFTSQEVACAIAEGLAVDPEPAATNFVNLAQRVCLPDLIAAGRMFQAAVFRLAAAAATIENWPPRPQLMETDLGPIWLGTRGDDTYTNAALLIIEPGGADTYRAPAGVANGLAGQPLAAIVDLAGDDRYTGDSAFGPGTAVWGLGVLYDAEGRDDYRAANLGQAAGMYGCAWLEDRAGDDVYRAGAHGQAAGYVGVGILRDEAGNDLYDLGQTGQGFAGVLGFGLLVDRAGNDRYMAGNREPDHERNDSLHYLSLAQGCAIGRRP